MNLVKSLSHFWNVTLGVDCPEETKIEDNPEMEELKASLERIEKLEQKLSTTNNAGKGGKASKVVETVTVEPKLAKKVASKTFENENQENSIKEKDDEIEK